jgi:hypothetical protein
MSYKIKMRWGETILSAEIFIALFYLIFKAFPNILIWAGLTAQFSLNTIIFYTVLAIVSDVIMQIILKSLRK